MSNTIYQNVNYRKICQEYNGYTDEQMKGMHVHHIDCNHHNNDPENLLLCTPEEHAEFHPHMKNWIRSEHQVAATEAARLVNTGKTQSEEHKRKKAKAHMQEIEIDGILYESAEAASKEIGYSSKAIGRWAKKNGSRYGITITHTRTGQPIKNV